MSDDAIKTRILKIRIDPDQKRELRWAAEESGHAGISSFLRAVGMREAKRLRDERNRSAGSRRKAS